MSTLKVDTITNADNDGGPEFTTGVAIPDGQPLTGNVNITGICTATTFNGVGTGITTFGDPNEVTTSKAIAIIFATN